MTLEVIIWGTVSLSLLHAIIPNHWLPLVAIGRKEGWSLGETLRVTLLAGLGHAVSTILIGVSLGLLGIGLGESVEHFAHVVGPIVLIALGVFFLWQHHRHKHFHLKTGGLRKRSKRELIGVLVLAMFLSPCLEIEAYFLMAGTIGWEAILLISGLYLVISLSGMLVWVGIAYRGLLKLNWHAIEHNAGMITGLVLIVTGILAFYLH